jgi:hypothetical protein
MFYCFKRRVIFLVKKTTSWLEIKIKRFSFNLFLQESDCPTTAVGRLRGARTQPRQTLKTDRQLKPDTSKTSKITLTFELLSTVTEARWWLWTRANIRFRFHFLCHRRSRRRSYTNTEVLGNNRFRIIIKHKFLANESQFIKYNV